MLLFLAKKWITSNNMWTGELLDFLHRFMQKAHTFNQTFLTDILARTTYTTHIFIRKRRCTKLSNLTKLSSVFFYCFNVFIGGSHNICEELVSTINIFLLKVKSPRATVNYGGTLKWIFLTKFNMELNIRCQRDFKLPIFWTHQVCVSCI